MGWGWGEADECVGSTACTERRWGDLKNQCMALLYVSFQGIVMHEMLLLKEGSCDEIKAGAVVGTSYNYPRRVKPKTGVLQNGFLGIVVVVVEGGWCVQRARKHLREHKWELLFPLKRTLQMPLHELCMICLFIVGEHSRTFGHMSCSNLPGSWSAWLAQTPGHGSGDQV